MTFATTISRPPSRGNDLRRVSSPRILFTLPRFETEPARLTTPVPAWINCLEHDLARELKNASRVGGGHDTEIGAIDQACWIVELGMVEHIESLGPQLQFLGLVKLKALEQCHIEVVQAGAMEKSPAGISQLTQIFQAEQACIEIGLAAARIGVSKNLARRKVRLINACAGEGQIPILADGDWKAGSQGGDAGNRPSTEHLPCPRAVASKFLKRKLNGVAAHKIVGYIEAAKAPAHARIEGIRALFQAGGVIEALAERITSQELNGRGAVPHAQLKRVVRGVGVRLLKRVAAKRGAKNGIAHGRHRLP